jgi:hypothetical protein
MLKNEKVLRNVPKLILICIGDSDGNATPTGAEFHEGFKNVFKIGLAQCFEAPILT